MCRVSFLCVCVGSCLSWSAGGHVTTAEAGGAADGEAPLMRGCWGSGEEVDVLMLNRKTLFIEVH